MCAPLESSVFVYVTHCSCVSLYTQAQRTSERGDRFIVRLCGRSSAVVFLWSTSEPGLPESRALVVHKYIVIVMVYALADVHAVLPNKSQHNTNMLIFCSVLHGQQSHRSRGEGQRSNV